ncbi:YceI-like domain-containing protein [Salegentibacter echinorum]|uniref:YceI-like domain-containing protein n=1 Tax=Salegentibacter echinorum TaxID=1073325 RepID=A0A1M5L0B3_SALEC|nr:YceI family protein [Salegentibacter echinorum]SHG58405.1 YceI-like domain-containing protein [Salegentibacter echinorum]
MKKNVFNSLMALVVVFSMVSFAGNPIKEKQVKVKQSEITWQGEKVTGFHEGTIALKDGFLIMEDGKLKGGEFVIDMTSITVTDLSGENKGKLEGHLKSDDFFGVKNYPTAKMVIKSASKKNGNTYGVVGDLTIKGKTNPVTFNMEVEENEAEADIVIDRSKYDVRYGSGSFFDNLGDKTIYDNFELDVELKF